ncbi:unnamed protein product, partial [Allacma fusca]
EQIKHTRDYKLPRESDQSLEPSCAWVPARSLKTTGIESHLTTPGQPTEADLKLKFPAIDPFRYFHNSGTKPASRDRSRDRSREHSRDSSGNNYRSGKRPIAETLFLSDSRPIELLLSHNDNIPLVDIAFLTTAYTGRLDTAQGTCSAIGEVFIRFTFYGRACNRKFLVIPSLPRDVILGTFTTSYGLLRIFLFEM